MQSGKNIARHGAADPKILRQLCFNDPKLTKDLAGRDLFFDLFIDMAPCPPGLQRIVHRVGHIQRELADVATQRCNALALLPHKIAAPLKAVDKTFRHQKAQGRLHGNPARLHHRCDRAFQQHQTFGKRSALNVGPQDACDQLIAWLLGKRIA